MQRRSNTCVNSLLHFLGNEETQKGPKKALRGTTDEVGQAHELLDSHIYHFVVMLLLELSHFKLLKVKSQITFKSVKPKRILRNGCERSPSMDLGKGRSLGKQVLDRWLPEQFQHGAASWQADPYWTTS